MRPPILSALVLAAAFLGGDARGQELSDTATELEQAASATPAEKVAYAESANGEIREAEKQISRLLEQSRRESDAEAIECLLSRLTSVRALLQVSEASEISMRNAIASSSDEMANHEFRKVAVAVGKTRMLVAEAQRCASHQELESGTTLLDWSTMLAQYDDDLPDQTATTITNLEPPPVSPFF
jgi:hypothetical protein